MFFPGRNGPARPSAAGRSRPPGHSRPSFAGPAAAYSVLSEHGFKSAYRMYASSHYYWLGAPSAAAFFIANSRGPCASQDHPATRAKHAPLHHPPGAHVGTTLPAAACAAAAALRAASRFARALRASLVPCPPGPSRMCLCLLGTALTHS